MSTMIDPATKIKELTVPCQNDTGKPSTFVLTDTSLYVNRPDDTTWPEILVSLRYVLWAETKDGSLEVCLLTQKKPVGCLRLVHISGRVPPAQQQDADAFAQAVLEAAYQGVKKHRHVLILVNPIAGPGKSRTHLNKKILPILTAARCTSDVTVTAYYKHAWEIARDLPLSRYDAIAAVSGDGIIHELMNGFAEHKNPTKAFQTPLVPIPAGSANALSLNLLGLEEGFDISAATLNVVKGRPMNVDICSVTQKDRRAFSFMSQAIGLMAELDLGTEYLRFMGDSRFIYGYLRGLVLHRACPVKVSIKVAQSDKDQMVEDLRAGEAAAARHLQSASDAPAVGINGNGGDAVVNGDSPTTQADTDLPPLKYSFGEQSGDGWIVFEKPVLYLFGGKGPLVARDLMQFPMSLPDDGYVDLVIQEKLSRKVMLQAMDGAERGKTYWMDTQHYFKAEAYRVEPLQNTSCLSVDGEEYPFEPFQVECHKGLATLLSPYGVYNVKFDVPKTT
ncbi:uncharacterized protein PHACADRAFT_256300 [Phanerochaete carnosa HHB-10118-sp]|uniref:DAGKc domain-containing protein n=1 Tax=Phanerochaete carnosa (strain HHB-10118-sp) TaxID=650164 RepID=K5UZH9_PHACS|nr:uncharacterized protein PHACADRAFT_256300 [Phanerochaete carnosa HHB-10118-sp]EKM55581.1 hypothetical protein PHACADRAFT_256300 [Phanerochaete carnosa HHB-10118-sp]